MIPSMADPMPRRDVLKLAGAASLAVAGGAADTEAAMQRGASVAKRRAALYGLLGDLPARNRAIGGRKRGEALRDGYVLETWDLDLNGLETVPAYVARPQALAGRAPAVVFNHSHGGGYKIGKEEFVAGREYLQPVPYAKALTDLGYVAMAVDHWVFGERSHASELDTFKSMLWHGQVLWGMMVYDSLRAVDFLLQRADVDAARVATLGISMGSTMAWYLAALDERIKVTVDICCLTDFQALIADKGLSRHGVYYYVPSLLKHFTTSQINELIVPRAHLGLAGTEDKLTPVAGLDVIDASLKRAYAAAGHPERWALLRYPVGHQETAEGRTAILAFLQQHL
jgi:dienelactone hydrolase